MSLALAPVTIIDTLILLDKLLCALAEEMIDNDIDSSPNRSPSHRNERDEFPVPVRTHLTAHPFQVY